MEKHKKRFFGKVTEIAPKVSTDTVNTLTFTIHLHFEKFGYADDFYNIMLKRDIGVIMVGKEVDEFSKKIKKNMLCEVYGLLLNIQSFDSHPHDDSTMSSYVITDNITIHYLD